VVFVVRGKINTKYNITWKKRNSIHNFAGTHEVPRFFFINNNFYNYVFAKHFTINPRAYVLGSKKYDPPITVVIDAKIVVCVS
jgi:TPP-dependent pyruvate/acetoin dehydrogenase alpha subunit